MGYNVTASFSTEQAKREGTHPIDMYVINASPSGTDYHYYVHLNNNVVGYALNATGDITSATTLYTRAWVERDDVNTNVQGEINEISFSVPNIDRAMESIIQSKDYLRGRDVHVLTYFAKHLPAYRIQNTGTPTNYKVDDETGVTFNASNNMFSFKDGQSFIEVEGLDLSTYTGDSTGRKNFIVLKDSEGYSAWGWIGEAGSGESLGSNLVTNGDFETGDTSGWSTANATAVATTTDPYGGSYCLSLKDWGSGARLHQTLDPLESKSLYKFSFYAKKINADPGGYIYSSTNNSVHYTNADMNNFTASVWEGLAHYFTANNDVEGNDRLFVYAQGSGDDGDEVYYDNIYIKEVTDCNTDGVHIYNNNVAGSQNWIDVHASFNYKDSSYTFDIYEIKSPAKYIGATPDHQSYLKEKYYIDSVNTNEKSVTFNCKSKFDIKKIQIPGRRFTGECQWALKGKYLASECDYGGNINSASYPTCDGTLENCRERGNENRFGGFPSIPRGGITII